MEPFKEGNYYHIYNRGARKKNIFRSHHDYIKFAQNYHYYLFPCIQTFAWCLLNNHFHALIRVRTLAEQADLYREKTDFFGSDDLHGKLDPSSKPYNASRQLSHLMNSYTRYFNKKYSSSGTIIEGPLKRKKVMDEDNFNHLICYIHRNPIHHGVSKIYTEFSYCSYLDFLIDKDSFVEKETVLRGFGGKLNFIEAHKEFRLKIDDSGSCYLE